MNDTKEIGKIAFYHKNVSLSILLSETYPFGCTLTQAIAWAAKLDAETVEGCIVLG